MTDEIVVIEGDGIGREVVPAAVDVLESLDVDFEFVAAEAGDATRDATGEALPDETYDLVADADATADTRPRHTGCRSIRGPDKLTVAGPVATSSPGRPGAGRHPGEGRRQTLPPMRFGRHDPSLACAPTLCRPAVRGRPGALYRCFWVRTVREH